MPVFHAAAALPPAHRPRPAATATLRALAAACALLLAGCATYHRAPLTQQDTSISAGALARLRIDPATMPLPALAAHRFDPSNGLDIEEVAMLAVANNPALKLARDDLGVARAQAFAAGLLPDPQLSVASDYPGQAGFARAFNYGLSMDVMAIVTRGANQKSADATAAKIDLGLLWQEWQVVAQAKQLFLKACFEHETLPLLLRLRDLSRVRYARMAAAQRAGNLTDDTVSAALTAYNDANKAYGDAQRAAGQTRHDLNDLLGLAPDVRLQLAADDKPQEDLNDLLGLAPDVRRQLADADSAPLAPTTLDAALAALPRRRPDLLALQAGYAAQEQKYRAAILSQFPSLSVGFVRARDTSEIYTSGFQINLSLPIFNRNRGNIAIEKATRQRLRDEYQTRLNQAYADVARLRADGTVLRQQLTQAETALPGMALAARHAARAYTERNLALGPYTDAQSAALTQRIAVATLRDALGEQRVALQALLGSAIPDAFSADQTYTNAHAQ